MVKVLREPTRKDAILHLLPINREGLMSEVEIGGHLSHSHHKVNKFKMSVGRRKSATKTLTLDIRRADFRFLRELVSKVPSGKMLLKVLASISAGHLLSITSYGHWSRKFQNVGSQADEGEGSLC